MQQEFIATVIGWFEHMVLGLNLCPFANKPYREGAVLFTVSDATSEETCLMDLQAQLQRLDDDAAIETIVLICPQVFPVFEDYNQFLDLADLLLQQQGWTGIYQVASFHPDYVFADCEPSDQANWTNRSPYPLLHLLRDGMA